MLRVAIPLTVVFDGKQIRQEMSYGEILWTTYDGTSNGWVNSEIFDSSFFKHFKAYARSTWPLLLLLDGHSSHFDPRVLRLGAESDVIIFCLQTNTTNLTQPLDFAPLKSLLERRMSGIFEETSWLLDINFLKYLPKLGLRIWQWKILLKASKPVELFQ